MSDLIFLILDFLWLVIKVRSDNNRGFREFLKVSIQLLAL